MLNEQSNILTSTEQPTTSKADPPDRGPPPPHPGKATPCPMLHWPAIWNHLHIEGSCGFQWCDVDAVTPEFPQNLHNTSPEYFRHLLTLTMSKTVKGPASNTKKVKKPRKFKYGHKRDEECRVCKKQVGEEDQGLECEICKKWWHLGCVDIEDSQYKMIARHCKGTIHWY